MIIGKSLTALGGGGLKPEINVTAKAGALMNLHYKDSSIILQSYQLGVEETQHTFVVDVSETAYVVEDVTNSASVEVLVDSVAVFDAEIYYALWLYNGDDNGNEFVDVTGGWILYQENTSSGSFLKDSDHMQVTYSYYSAGLRTYNEEIPNPGYNTFHAVVNSTVSGNNSSIEFKPKDKEGLYATVGAESDYHEVVMDISSVNQIPFRVLVYGQYYSSNGGTVYIKKVWLE